MRGRRGNAQFTKKKSELRDHSQRFFAIVDKGIGKGRRRRGGGEGRNIECQTVCSEFQEKEAPPLLHFQRWCRRREIERRDPERERREGEREVKTASEGGGGMRRGDRAKRARSFSLSCVEECGGENRLSLFFLRRWTKQQQKSSANLDRIANCFNFLAGIQNIKVDGKPRAGRCKAARSDQPGCRARSLSAHSSSLVVSRLPTPDRLRVCAL